MSDSTIRVIRASTANLNVAREAIIEVAMPTSASARLFDEQALVEFLQTPSNFLLVALEGQKVAGSLYGYALPHPHTVRSQFFLYGIDVRVDFRGRGIGKRLVGEFVSMAKSAGASEVWVLTNESNKAAVAMYTGAGMNRQAEDDVCFILPLNVE